MATKAKPPRLTPPVRPGAEAKSWLFMRLSGLMLVFFALVHFAITHVLNDVVETDYRFVADRWANPAWRVFDWMLLALALLHGANGARWVIEDYVRRPGPRAAAKTLAYGLTAAMLAWGTFTIVTF
ncbi:MAG TPA: succinate dehydrogenase, hydrophobic membrane anchor protein [Acidimicrobiales bacterium]